MQRQQRIMKREKAEVLYVSYRKKIHKNEAGQIREIDKEKLTEILSKRQIHI